MRSAASQHVVPITDASGRRVVNIGGLLSFLNSGVLLVKEEVQETSVSRKGKKRAANAVESGRHKRIKKERSESALGLTMFPSAQETSTVIPVYRHTMELAYKASEDHKKGRGSKLDAGEVEVEKAFTEFIRGYTGENTTHAIGNARVLLRGAELLVTAATQDPVSSYVAVIPYVDAGFDMDAHDMRAPYARDPLVACVALRDAGRADVSMSLRIVILPTTMEFTEPEDKDLLPFRLVLDIEVALRVPAIFAPIPFSKKAAVSQIEDAQRRALSFIFPPSPTTAQPEARTVDIPLLYSSLKPAPRLAPVALEEHAQPRALRATLLPFQRRTVAWLLARESKTLSPDAPGTAVSIPSSAAHLPIFWQCLETEEGVWYHNRLTGQITDRAPEEDQWSRGGILAEEPGLGKTLECIALILLNPALDRVPTTKKWNAESKIEVKEIKVR